MSISQPEKAVIIGWYRSGVSLDKIAILSGHPVLFVQSVIDRYLLHGRHIQILTYTEIMQTAEKI